MQISSRVFKAGTRPSSLALTQTRDALDRMEAMLPGISFEMVPISSVGDTDRTTDLRESPADFFTRELDSTLLAGEIDLAVHSAKDLPDPMPGGIDWFWLPWREEPRDVLIFSNAWKKGSKDWKPVIGVSSDRRAEYCAKRFPNGIQKNIRGNIEERIAQVDDGTFDVIFMAAAALFRLGIEGRIDEWISLEELRVPDGQGYLAVTFRAGNEKMLALRDRIAPLAKKRILLTCSEACQERANPLVRNLGGTPIPFPLIHLECRRDVLPRCAEFDWLIITSPSAVKCLMEAAGNQTFPKILACGRGTADELAKHGLAATAVPSSGYSADSLVELAKGKIMPHEKVLRIRSDKAGPQMADALRRLGADVDDCIIYDNKRIVYDSLPDFGAVFFASASGVESFIEQWGVDALSGKTLLVIGIPTANALEKHSLKPDVIAREATVASAIGTLAEHCVAQTI